MRPSLLTRMAACVPMLLLAVAAPQAFASESPGIDRLIEKRELRVGMSGDQPPYNVRNKSGKMIGLEVDIAEMLAAGLGVELTIIQSPFGDLLDALAKGEVDMVMSGTAITPERARTTAFVGPYMIVGKSILTRSQLLADSEETADMNQEDLRFSVLRNSTSQQFVERAMPLATLMLADTYDGAIALLRNGEVDAMIADSTITTLALLRYPDAGFVTLAQPFTIEPVGIAVSADDPRFRDLINNYVEALERSGFLDALRLKWTQDGSWIAQLP